jgi:pyruvate/2-oxoglutarate dehydrogenase complex dihydrolipoamide dehydrogenase (E3) component
VDSFSPAAKASKVVVVGAGPAGLEAARVAALKGHHVTLFESRTQLGGGLALWAMLPGREFFTKSIAWWERELARLGVKVRLGTSATAENVLALSPDAVMVATGALWSRSGRSAFLDQDIPGAEKAHVYRPEDILLHSASPTGNVVLLDGEGTHASLGLAELLAEAGARVQYLTPGFSPFSARVQDSFESEVVVKRLLKAGVVFTPCTYVRQIGDRDVMVFDVNTERESTLANVDAVVLSTGREPVDALAAELEGKVAQVFTIGDALGVRPLAAAAYEGQKFARYIGEPGAPKTAGEMYFRGEDLAVFPLPADA